MKKILICLLIFFSLVLLLLCWLLYLNSIQFIKKNIFKKKIKTCGEDINQDFENENIDDLLKFLIKKIKKKNFLYYMLYLKLLELI